MKLLEGKTCLVTGANRGIGNAVARVFCDAGATVYANARQEKSLDELVSDYDSTRIVPLYFDVCDHKAMKEGFLRVKEVGSLDVLVNNAGIMRDAVIGMVSSSLMREIFETNVFAVIEATQLATGIMRRSRSGSIINFSSIVGVKGNAGQSAYAASKGAIIAFTKTAAKELAPQGIRVNAVAPGFIDTEMFRSIGDERVTKMSAEVGMGRLGTPTDVANTCLYLASDLSEYVTGQIIGIDGAARI